MKRTIGSGLMTALVALTVVGYESTAHAQLTYQAKRVSMRVGRHQNVAEFNETQYDANFAEASSNFLGDSGTNDIGFPLTLQRMGDDWWFGGAGSTDIVNNSTQFNATINNFSKSFLNVVNQINWCGYTAPFLGCATYEKPYLVTRDAVLSNLGPLATAHEYGHRCGLPHVNSPANQIMSTNAALQNVRVWSTNHVMLFRDPVSYNCNSSGVDGAVRLCVLEAEWVVYGQSTQTLLTSEVTPLPSVQDLAQGGFFGSLPVWADSHYKRKDIETLKGMLQDPRYEKSISQIVTLIGLTSDGSAHDIQVLDAYAKQAGSRLAPVMMALGSIAARNRGHKGAMAVLTAFFAAGYTEDAGFGLTISGTSEGHKLLSQMSVDPTISAERRQHFSLAAAENRRVSRLGFRGHYASPDFSSPPPSVSTEPGRGGPSI